MKEGVREQRGKSREDGASEERDGGREEKQRNRGMKKKKVKVLERNAKSRSEGARLCTGAQDGIQSLSNLNEHQLPVLALPLIIHSAFVRRRLSSDNCSPRRRPPPSLPARTLREYQGILHPGINAPNHLARFRSRIHPPPSLGQDNPGSSVGYMPLIIKKVRGEGGEEKTLEASGGEHLRISVPVYVVQ